MGGLWSKFEPFRTASSDGPESRPNSLKITKETTLMEVRWTRRASTTSRRRATALTEMPRAGLLYCDFVDPNADPRVYQEVEDIDKLKLVVNDFLEEHNAESKSPMPLVRARRLDVWRWLPFVAGTRI